MTNKEERTLEICEVTFRETRSGKSVRNVYNPTGIPIPKHTDEEYEKQDQLCKNLEHWVLNLKSDKAKLEARIKELEARIAGLMFELEARK